jgi:hypothetical protein
MRQRRDWVQGIAEDVKVIVERTDRGTLIITFDMSPETEAELTAYAESQLIDLDTLLRDVQNEALVKRTGKAPEFLRSWRKTLN